MVASGVRDNEWPSAGVAPAAAPARARLLPRAGALRWVGGVYLLLLGLALLLLPPVPTASTGVSDLRGALTVGGGLALLWLAGLVPRRRVAIAVSAAVAVPQLWFAADFVRQGSFAGAGTLGLLALGLLATAGLPEGGAVATSRADALGLVFGAAQAIQGASYILQPQAAGPIPGALGLSAAAAGALQPLGGVVVVLAQFRPELPPAARWGAHLFGGGVLLAAWLAVSLRVDPAYLFLGAATLVRGAAIVALPWLSDRLERFDGRALGPRLGLTLGTTALAPLLLALPLVLNATGEGGVAGRAAQADVRRAVFGATLLLLSAVGLAAWWLAARLTATVAALVGSVEATAAGRRGVALPRSGVTELARLEGAVRTMAATIADREAELERRRREFESLAEHAPDIVARFDRDLRHVYVNPAGAALTGIPQATHLGRTNAELGMPPDLVALWEACSRAAFATGEEQHYSFTYLAAEGERHFRARLVPEVDADGAVETLLAVTYDITAQVRAELERAALLDALAHDLKNPITAIGGQAQLLRRQVGRGIIPEHLAERLAGVENQAKRMATLLDALRAGARDAADAPERRPVELVALVREAAEDARRGDPDHPIRVESDGATLTGAWDADQLGRVIANLLDNARKYSPAGGAVVIGLARDGDAATLRVRDEGIGIPAADLPHIFGFRRRAGNVGDIAGSGVGLASCKRLVEAHGGTIAVESVEGHGTTVTVRLPLAPG